MPRAHGRCILGIFLYRSLSLKQFYKVTMDTIETTAGVLLIVGAASLFGWVLTTTRLTEYAAEALLSYTNNRYVILLLINVLLLVIGCFLEPIASISILVPVLMPIITKVGIDPVHFGVMMTLNLMIGLLHPPLGMVLFVLAQDIQAVDRANHHGDPALADPAAGVAGRHHADSRADAVAAALCGVHQVARRDAGASLLRRRFGDRVRRVSGSVKPPSVTRRANRPLLRHQLAEGAALDDAAAVQHQDGVGVGDRGQAVGDDEGGAALAQPVERALDLASVSTSSALVASSRIRIGASLRMARAMARRWRSPPDSEAPRSPMTNW